MYTDVVSLKFQITVPEPLMAEMKNAAEKTGVSVAELIRQTMHDSLQKKKRSSKVVFFDSITGLVDSDETDLASQVDQVLYR